MSSSPTIKVENLSKCYQIYTKPLDRLLQMFSFGYKKYYREFWAVENISFEINKGETLGIIGKNGSGKSTLLQLICGTLNPTLGNIHVKGKIAALLELGSGFNPEFTGRENIYMNGSIYGLSQEQIEDRFDKIAEFADIGDFLEQPVKTYSSGMTVRLAFAVIAHVDADILVIDEALAVGDAVFTQKCMRFIREFKEKGTLIFVSHDLSSVQNLCQTVIWLAEGKMQEIGSSKTVAEHYLRYTLQEISGEEAELTKIEHTEIKQSSERKTLLHPSAKSTIKLDYTSEVKVLDNTESASGWRTGRGEIISVNLENLDDPNSSFLKGGERVRMKICAKAIEDLKNPILGFLVRDRLGQDLFGENTLAFTDLNPFMARAGENFEGEFVFKLPMLPNGQYAVMASVADGNLHDNIQHHWLHDALIFHVSSSKIRWGLVGIPFEKVEIKCKS